MQPIKILRLFNDMKNVNDKASVEKSIRYVTV